MRFKKEALLFTFVLLVILLNLECVKAFDEDGKEVTDRGSTSSWNDQDFNKALIPPGGDYTGTTTQELTYNGVTFPIGSKIEVKGGLINAEQVKLPNDGTVAVKDAKIEGGKIVSGSIDTGNGNWQNVQDASISTTETTMSFTTYATITPATTAGTTTLVNAKGVRSTRTSLTVAHADSVSVGGTTFTNVNNFTTNFVTFSLDSADTAIAETMVFNKIENSSFTLSNNQLISAKIQSQIDNNTFKFPNLIPQSSKFIEVNADKGQSFSINYRKTTDKGECVYSGQDSDANYNEMLSLGKRIVLNNSQFTIIHDPLFKTTNIADDGNYSLLIASNKAVHKTSSGFEITDACELKTNANRKTTELTLDKQMSVLLDSNMSFASKENNAFFSITENHPPVYRAVRGTFNYTTAFLVEQLESTCGIAEVNVDIAKGFVKMMLSPQFTVLCSGSRYNLIDKIMKEKSYSVYNIGLYNYYLGFEKGTTFMNFKAAVYSDNYGFIYSNKNVILNKVIEYDRIPNKYQFPALSDAEYINLPLDFKKVVASTHGSNKINITSEEERINLFMENRNITIPVNITLFETNSGFFNIKEKKKEDKVHRFAEFNKEMLYPDYIERYEAFFGYTTPLITIENKTLTQSGISEEGKEKVVKLYTPNTEESKSFLEWLKGRAIIKDITEFIRSVLNG